mmetsp:Transcript_27865/g.61698  ORF Transcript_27865/g.61698 Transcript_27865/m.61698 type:complete len:203 (+) Transcript_27865:1877-2485(+)
MQGRRPVKMRPCVPSTVTTSPARTSSPADVRSILEPSGLVSRAAVRMRVTQGLPMPRQRMAALENMPPLMVIIAEAERMARASWAEHSCRHSTTSPLDDSSMHSAAVKASGPVTTPREAATPMEKGGLASCSAAMCWCRKNEALAASTRSSASLSVSTLLSTRSTAKRMAALGERRAACTCSTCTVFSSALCTNSNWIMSRK